MKQLSVTSPHFSHPIYSVGGSGRIYCVTATRKRVPPASSTYSESTFAGADPQAGAPARLVSTAISTASLRSSVRNAGYPYYHFPSSELFERMDPSN